MTTLFFDLDGTLLDHSRSEREAALALYDVVRPAGRSREEFSAHWHAAQEQYFGRYLTGAISYLDQRRARMREVVDDTLTDARVDELFAVYLEAYERHWRIYPDAIPCLELLAGLTLGVITNGDEAQQRRKLEFLGLSHRFRYVVISGAVGFAKPAPEIFLHACAQAGADPAAAIYVGDRFDLDAEGARHAGLTGVWLNRTGAPAPHPVAHEISGLDQLPPLVGLLEAEGAALRARSAS